MYETCIIISNNTNTFYLNFNFQMTKVISFCTLRVNIHVYQHPVTISAQKWETQEKVNQYNFTQKYFDT